MTEFKLNTVYKNYFADWLKKKEAEKVHIYIYIKGSINRRREIIFH